MKKNNMIQFFRDFERMRSKSGLKDLKIHIENPFFLYREYLERMRKKRSYNNMKEIANSSLMMILVVIGLVYIIGLSLAFLKKAYTRCLELV